MPPSQTISLKVMIGDSVAFQEAFVARQTYPNAMSLARGKVAAIHHLDRVILADIEWDRPGLPKRINVKNLRIEKAIPSGS